MATIFLIFVVCTCAVSGIPVSSLEKPTTGESGSDEIELSSYVTAEFGKFAIIAILPSPSFGNDSRSSLQPIMFEDEIFKPNESENNIDSIKPVKRKPTTFRISLAKRRKINDMAYGERFFSKPIMTNDCPKDHVYSKIQKRCLKKYNSRGSSAAVIG